MGNILVLRATRMCAGMLLLFALNVWMLTTDAFPGESTVTKNGMVVADNSETTQREMLFAVVGRTVLDYSYFLSGDITKRLAFAKCFVGHMKKSTADPIHTDEINQALTECFPEPGDKYMEFILPRDKESFEIGLGASYGGVGVLLELNEDKTRVRITKIFPGSPLEGTEVRTGDVITAVLEDGKRTMLAGKRLSEAAAMIRGPIGTSVVLEIWRDGTVLGDFRCVRKAVDPRVIVEKTFHNGSVGYIQVLNFGNGIFKDKIESVLDALRARGVRNLIIDVRDNPGGIVVDASLFLQSFLDKGIPFLYTCRKDAKEFCKLSATSKNGTYAHMNVIVLVNAGSASASEILAGALQFHGRAIIVGEKTHGKGSVQTVFPITVGDTRTYFKLTTNLYYFDSERRVTPEAAGVTPDVVIKNPENGSRDMQLNAALELFHLMQR